jgi:hypothetical protein
MKRRLRKSRTNGNMGAWVAGIAIVVGAAVLTVSSLPSARRYLRVRAM